MKKNSDRIHAVLDGRIDPAACTPDESAQLSEYREALARLEASRIRAPAGLTAQIIASLLRQRPAMATGRGHTFWPESRQWMAPAFAGAAAMLLLSFGILHFRDSPQRKTVLMHFEIHAPGAHMIDLVGSFNQWTPGAIRLEGPDASGHWKTDVKLPEGLHEYQFLVDGKNWVTDPNAMTHRPDGFGHENAVVDVYNERS
jgi:hypothetical protein